MDSIGCSSNLDSICVMDFTSGINLFENKNIKIFPNPAYNAISLIFDDQEDFGLATHIAIYSSTYQRVLSKDMSSKTIDISMLVPGSYFLFIKNEKIQITTKFIKLE